MSVLPGSVQNKPTPGGIDMRASYTHIQAVEKEILEMQKAGKTYREIAEHYGFRDGEVVRECVKRYRRKQRRLEAGILPRRRGRPPKGYEPTEQERDNEIRRLKMENDLLRDFLRAAGRR
jgi:hypothetical protein